MMASVLKQKHLLKIVLLRQKLNGLFTTCRRSHFILFSFARKVDMSKHLHVIAAGTAAYYKKEQFLDSLKYMEAY